MMIMITPEDGSLRMFNEYELAELQVKLCGSRPISDEKMVVNRVRYLVKQR